MTGINGPYDISDWYVMILQKSDIEKHFRLSYRLREKFHQFEVENLHYLRHQIPESFHFVIQSLVLHHLNSSKIESNVYQYKSNLVKIERILLLY